VHSVEPAGFDDYARSLKSGRIERNARPSGSICDALMSPSPGEMTFAINSRLLGEGLAVSDAEAAEAVRFAFEVLKIVLEPGGAVALAAVLSGKIDTRGKAIGVIASGGNCDPELYARILTGARSDPGGAGQLLGQRHLEGFAGLVAGDDDAAARRGADSSGGSMSRRRGTAAMVASGAGSKMSSSAREYLMWRGAEPRSGAAARSGRGAVASASRPAPLARRDMTSSWLLAMAARAAHAVLQAGAFPPRRSRGRAFVEEPAAARGFHHRLADRVEILRLELGRRGPRRAGNSLGGIRNSTHAGR